MIFIIYTHIWVSMVRVVRMVVMVKMVNRTRVFRCQSYLIRHPAQHRDDEQDDEGYDFDSESLDDDRQRFDGALATVREFAAQCRDHLHKDN